MVLRLGVATVVDALVVFECVFVLEQLGADATLDGRTREVHPFHVLPQVAPARYQLTAHLIYLLQP